MGVSAHLPVRPDWMCGGCGLAWPCPTRRNQLAAEYAGARVSLMLYLAGCLAQACTDLPGQPAGVLYERFLLWPRTLPSQE